MYTQGFGRCYFRYIGASSDGQDIREELCLDPTDETSDFAVSVRIQSLFILRASLCKILISSFAHKMDFAHNFSVDFF